MDTARSDRAKTVPPLDQPFVGIGFQEASSRLLKKWRIFSGRASRGEYWWALLYVCLIDVLFIVLEYFFESFVLAVYGWWLFVLVPMLAVSVRRLHDANMSGWWALAPCIGNVAGLCIQMSPVIKVVGALGTIYPTQFADTLARGVASSSTAARSGRYWSDCFCSWPPWYCRSGCTRDPASLRAGASTSGATSSCSFAGKNGGDAMPLNRVPARCALPPVRSIADNRRNDTRYDRDDQRGEHRPPESIDSHAHVEQADRQP